MYNMQAARLLKVSMDKRILNEFGSKILNEERLDMVMQSRRQTRLSTYSEMLFSCECDAHDCQETISLSTEEYEKVHTKTKYFIVVPSHVRPDLEEVISSFSSYVQVGKYFPGPARV